MENEKGKSERTAVGRLVGQTRANCVEMETWAKKRKRDRKLIMSKKDMTSAVNVTFLSYQDDDEEKKKKWKGGWMGDDAVYIHYAKGD